MKYFAQFLPVDGKVEIGDYFIDTGVMSNGTLIGKRANKEGVYDYQKVKLFLCSRDVQIGDKNIYTGFKGVFEENDTEIVKEIKYQHQLEFIRSNAVNGSGVFKVVGQISPYATWVKAWDEFDEEDIEYNHKERFFGTGKSIWMKISKEAFNISKLQKRIRIKGLCGHFH